MTHSDLRLVLIEWEDSHANGEWQEIDSPLQDRALVCRSVGWLVLDGKRAKVIAPHMNESEPGVVLQGCGIMTIPPAAIISMTGLMMPKRTAKRRRPRGSNA